MNTKKLCFYFDESYHDRAIKLSKGGDLNIFSDEISDTFVGAFVGIENDRIYNFEEKFLKFESKYKEIYGIPNEKEFKGTIIAKKNFNFGIAKLNYNATKFYSEFFDILNNNKCIIQLNLFSKIEKLLSEVFEESLNNLDIVVNPNSFIYSITKLIFRYRDLDIAKKLLSSNSNYIYKKEIINEIKQGLEFICKQIHHIPRKVIEEKTINVILFILDLLDNEINLDEKVRWNYDPIFEGLDKLLSDLKISYLDIEIKLDEEENILRSAKKYKDDIEVESYDSKKVVGIRAADILANFFGRLIYSMQIELEEPEPLNVKEDLHYISKEWFNLDKNQFILSQKILNLLEYRHARQINTGIYMDNSCAIFSYLKYINNYNNFDEYTKYSNQHHYIKGNKYMVSSLRNKYSEL